MPALFAALEAGGTKFLCAVGTGPNDLRAETRIPTTIPAETIGRAVEFFQAQARLHGPLAGLGVASFGPVDLHEGSPTWGYITSTPKPGWRNTDLVGPFKQALNLPVAFDTDVDGAALGEGRWGAAQGLDTFIYLTIGTGIGGGAFSRGQLVHGLIHPEMGHIHLPHDRQADPFAGVCPYHGDCFEGLASGPALEKRWGQSAETLPPDHPAWRLEAHPVPLMSGPRDGPCWHGPVATRAGGSGPCGANLPRSSPCPATLRSRSAHDCVPAAAWAGGPSG